MNIPNFITLIRLLLVPCYIIFFIIYEGDRHWVGALYFLLGGGALDVLDGFIARRFNMVTNIGAMLDPLADKLLLLSIALGLHLKGYLPAWLLVILIGRETIMILGGVINYLYTKIAISANYFGKLNTCFVYLLIITYAFDWEYAPVLARVFVGYLIFVTIVYINIFLRKIYNKKIAE
ncbi:CDP-alcohol phosphatidyltransferase family protein [Proteinivorax hydrogeniformans]|uniref:Phosphatidylglycerophosphate synthase n=1 Tax=Proteinivorax hydrogeniformans TaxID=1826727 RepID=A0AAU8HPS5_9FIRM